MSDYLELKEQIVATCLELERGGYLFGTYGNVSVRVAGGLLITPTRAEYRTINPADIVTVAFNGEVLAGSRLPSSELEVHRAIYLRREGVGAIVHTHSLYAAAAASLQRSIPPIVEEQSQVIGGEIACTSYVPAGQHQRLGEEAARALGDRSAVLLANHGAVSCGRTLVEASFACVVVERVCQMYLLARAAGEPVAIAHQFVQSERDRFLHRYGKAEDRLPYPDEEV